MTPFIVFSIVALIFFILEISSPIFFFLNFALAAVVCGLLGLALDNYNILIPIFTILSFLFVLFLRPLLNVTPNKKITSQFESQYIGKQAKAITNINAFTGRISIYDENWEARTSEEDDTEIPANSNVTIVSHNDLTMYVKKTSTKSSKGEK